ncbi:hypothetical protein RJ639_031868 [Escallonia herrerae]|uniref:RING-type E3 ubiquitin transferase n=1 Tax=Escallonia herrerae TaxID=1293975 RepID=A0AA88X0U8_9ASTE|nr:hypothetical protein RJ639_031868 [Escallonia herrerae]
MDDNGTHLLGLSPLTVAIIGIFAATTMLIAYHCAAAGWWNQQVFTTRWQRTQVPVANFEDVQISIDTSITELLPLCKYTKDIGSVSKTQGGTCAVCLCEFEDGEAVRVLPECLHPFHVPCIDMWLYSHSNCPLCRADMTPQDSLGHRLESDALRLPPGYSLTVGRSTIWENLCWPSQLNCAVPFHVGKYNVESTTRPDIRLDHTAVYCFVLIILVVIQKFKCGTLDE